MNLPPANTCSTRKRATGKNAKPSRDENTKDLFENGEWARNDITTERVGSSVEPAPAAGNASSVIDLAADTDNESSKLVDDDGQGLFETSGDEELLARLDGPAAGRRTRAVQRQQRGQQPQRRR